MGSAIILTIFSLCGLFSSAPLVLAQGDIDIYTMYKFVNVGDEVEITCTATIVDATVQWTRESRNDPTLPLITIADNDLLTSTFLNTGRYAMRNEHIENTDVYKIILTISNAQNEDSANYSCGFLDLQPYSERPKTELIVTEPATNMMLQVEKHPDALHEVLSGEIIEFDGNQKCNISCLVQGSNPGATITIRVGDEDITDKFEMFTNKLRLDVPDMPGVVREIVDVTAKAENFEMQTRFADKDLFCSANVPIQELLSTSFNIAFKGFMPEFHCESERMTHVGEKIDISCVVRANPAPSDMHFAWPLADKREVTLRPGERDGNYVGSQEQDGNHVTKMVLRINRVGRQMFRKHYFVATNNFGTAKHVVNIVPDPAHPLAARGGAAITSIMSSFLLVTAIHVIYRI